MHLACDYRTEVEGRLMQRRGWTRTATELPEPGVWLMGTVPGREYPMLVRLLVDGCANPSSDCPEPCWETRTGDTTPLAACSHWDYFEPLECE